MEFAPKDFFAEKEESDVKGFVIIEAHDGRYRLVEKWQRPTCDRWCTYWVDESELLARVEAGDCAKTTEVSSEQFEGILNLADISKQEQLLA